MSNTRRARWSGEQVTAADAVDALLGARDEYLAERVREFVTRNLTAEMAARGRSPGLIAGAERELMTFDDDYWLGIARDMFGT